MGFAAIYFLISLCLNIFTRSFCNRFPVSTCTESERQALLKFKHDLKDSSNMLASWETGDCCHWTGVICDNVTAHVTELHLGRSQLAPMANKAAVRPSLSGKLNPSLLALKYLSYLDLSDNDFERTPIPSWFWNLTSHLQYLDISGNQFQGKIPDLLTTSHASVVLNFSSNHFTGPLPRISFNVTALDLSSNAMSGSISLWNMTSHLQFLNISRNHFQGNIPDLLTTSHASVVLDFSSNNFTGPLPRISFNVTALDLSGNAMSGSISLWNMTSHLQYLNIARNHFQGNIPDLLTTSHASVVLDFSSNNFTGPLPRISFNVTALDLSNNSLSGSISQFLCNTTHQPMKLEVLNLRDNLFSEEIPDCWGKWPNLVAINFCDNKFSGNIPSSMGTLASLQSLHLRKNNLGGEVPSSLSNCTELVTVDFGANQLTGEIPPWMGEKLSKLIIISLQTNKFHASIPEEFCLLSSLQILDLSHNNLSGKIPSCIHNLSAMASRNKSSGTISYKTSGGCFFDSIELVMKGMVLDFSTILKLIKLVDISDNKLSGEIPEEVTSLTGLISLNLSRNLLDGRIPNNIGSMGSLECVDLSENNLSGEIPRSMTQLSFLSYLNLSNNNLTGIIPREAQFATFNEDSFRGTGLHLPPLTPTPSPAPTHSERVQPLVDDAPKVDWFFLCVEFGFLFGFLGVSGPIIISKSCDSRIFSFRHRLTNM